MDPWLLLIIIFWLAVWIRSLYNRIKIDRAHADKWRSNSKVWQGHYNDILSHLTEAKKHTNQLRVLLRLSYRVGDVALIAMFQNDGFQYIKDLRTKLKVGRPRKKVK